MGISYPETMQDRLADLGNIPLDRIRMNPPPGQATTADWLLVREDRTGLCELIDGTLVEKPMGWLESLLGAVLVRWMGSFVSSRNLGIVTGADGFTELYPETVRAPDVAFVAWSRLPNGKLPVAPLPKLVPNFVIEILSQGNTYSEMSRKRREYFQAGVQLVWIVDHRLRTITAYSAPNQFRVFSAGDTISADPVLPDWLFNTAELFEVLDQQPPG
jgi:Uma2 family endonuclease